MKISLTIIICLITIFNVYCENTEDIIFDPYLGNSIILPLDLYGNITDFSFGVSLCANVRNLLFQNSAFALNTGYNFISPDHNEINWFNQFFISALMGYAFPFWDGTFNITPYTGIGYLLHIIDSSIDTPGNETYYYSDMTLVFKTEFDMKVDHDVHFVLAPGCHIFFEPEHTGYFCFVDIGVRYRFHFDVAHIDDKQNAEPIYIKNAGFVFTEEKETLVADSEEKIAQNEQAFAHLVEICNKYKEYKIIIIGHAVNPYWNDPVKAEKANREKYIPLSKHRADYIRSELVKRGIDKNRISTEGHGTLQPIVPFSDFQNRWQNRRVEIILTKD
ncbi:MAG: OmpA family protein [Spirochaetales bacterium]|nr:OmpA family protein [Spirochaetales bacterium]